MKFSIFTALSAAITFLLPLAKVKQNRIVAGEEVWIFQIHPLFGIAAALILFLFFLLIYTRRFGPVFAYLFALLISLTVFGALYYLNQNTHLWDLQDFGRVSFDSGFWFYILTLYLLLSWSYRETESRILKNLILISPIILPAAFALAGTFGSVSIFLEYSNRREKFFQEFLHHIFLSLTAVGSATLIGVPAGIKAARSERWREPIFKIVSGIQTIPSLALFGLMIAPLALLSQTYPVLRRIGISGIGNAPALIALSLYSLLPIIRNTFTGIFHIESDIKMAAKGMGMNKRQTFRYIELPLSAPMVLTGIRISLVQSIGNTAVAALIGAGGLGTFIFQGLGQSVPDLILLGVIPVILLSVFFDRLFYAGEILATPKGVRYAWEE